MTITTTSAAPAARQACGCGEERIPGLLAKVGFYGTVGLGLAALIVMIAAGWALGAGVWLLRRRREQAAPVAERGPGALAGFTWTAEEAEPPPSPHPPLPQPRERPRPDRTTP
ncbi:hypothetical protein [Streptomyces sp. Act143]|uniref:hypothetical protein n=1 Tax=Streptomyces sp. Act143 TaxID=2200760 RepID=UPI0015E80BA7|nr:hypothetical protein [Streptomyces sp. Act143]